MSTIVMASVPIYGHVAPMVTLAAELTSAGHHIRFLTGHRFADLVERAGAEFVALPHEADFDDRTMNEGLDQSARPDGVAGLRYDVANVFLRPARAQHQALRSMMASAPDAVVVDPTFVGASLIAAAPRHSRPPVIVAGVLPLTLDSPDTPPFGLGLSPLQAPAGLLDRMRNRLLRTIVQRLVFGSVQRDYDSLFRAVVGTPAQQFVLSWVSAADAIVQFSVPAFEYPRPHATVPITFAGPVLQPGDGDVPPW